MTSEFSSDSEGDARLNGILAEFIQQTEAGRNPDPQQILARHPEFAGELQEFFNDKARFDRMAKPFKPHEDPNSKPLDVDATMLSSDQELDSAAADVPTVGSRLRYFGDYELLDEIARGGMGVVYRARQVNLKRTVALKMILAGQFAGEEEVRRFYAEAEAAAKLDHPGIVPIFEVGRHEGQHYFSMAFIEGESLGHALSRGIFAPRDAAEMTKKVAEAIAYAHVQGVIHRDLKPANVLVDKDGQPRVTDFGLAKRMQTGDAVSQHTATGQILGTPSYMPPEQASGQTGRIGMHSDIYSLGAILYCLLTGRPPFQAATPLDTVLQVIQQEPVSPRQLNAAIPRDLETITLKCLEKDPHKRYHSARELAEELNRFLKGEPIHARPVNRIERGWRWCRRNPVVAGLTAALSLALVSGSVISSILAVRAKHEASVSARLAIKANELATEKSALAEKSSASERLTRRYLYSAHMNLANEAWKSGNVLRVLELLNQHRPGAESEDLTSLDWGYLWQQCHRQRNTIALTKDEDVAIATVSPNGRWIAVGILGSTFASRGEDRTFREIRLWDVAAGTLGHTIRPKINPEDKQPDERFAEQVFSPDGKLLAVVAIDHLMVWHGEKGNGWGERKDSNPRIMIWEVETIKLRATIPLPQFLLGERVAISPDNKRLAAWSTSTHETDTTQVQSITVWDLPETDNVPVGPGKLLHQREMETGYGLGGNRLAFSADGQSLLLSILSRKNEFTVADASDAGNDVSYPIDHPFLLAVSPDGRYFANLDGDIVAKLHDAKTGKEIHAFPTTGWNSYGSTGWNGYGHLPRARFSPDSRLLAVARGTWVDVWDLETKKLVGEIRGPTDYIRDVGFGADSKTVITVAKNKATGAHEAKVWDVNTRPGPDEIPLAGKAPQIDPTDKKEVAHGLAVVAISPDAKTLATVWRFAPLGNQETSRVLSLHDFSSGSLGKQLVQLKWDVLVGNDWSVWKKQFLPHAVNISRDGKWLALSGETGYIQAHRDHQIQLWRIAPESTGIKATLERSLYAPQRLTENSPLAALSPDGTKLIYSVCKWTFGEGGSQSPGDTRLLIHDVATGADTPLLSPRIKDWERNEGACRGVAFSADGRRVFTGLRGLIVAWDTATGNPLSDFKIPGYYLHTLALSPDDNTLATCQDDHSISLWDVSEPKPRDGTGKLRAVLRGHSDHITAIAFHPDGKTLASSSNDRTIKIWDIATGELRLNLQAYAASVLSFTPDGLTMISADEVGTLKLWHSLKSD